VKITSSSKSKGKEACEMDSLLEGLRPNELQYVAKTKFEKDKLDTLQKEKGTPSKVHALSRLKSNNSSSVEP
jgi:uncharacterized protein YcbK (DUF882 family)